MTRVTLVVLSLFLTSCVAVFVAGASTGGLVVSDQRDFEARKDDSFIQHYLDVNIVQDPQFRSSHLEPATFNRIVLLVGETPTAFLKVTAEKIAQSIPNVRKIYNEITVQPPVSFAQEAQDTWITSAVKSALLVKPKLRSGSIKVITENNAVFLMGLVTKEQANLAVETARRVNGVKRVVKVFEYL